jgi:hypothetical protein
VSHSDLRSSGAGCKSTLPGLGLGLAVQVLDGFGADVRPRKPPEGGTPNVRILGFGICVDFWRSQDLQKPTLGVPGLPGSSGARLSEVVQPLDCKSSLPRWGHGLAVRFLDGFGAEVRPRKPPEGGTPNVRIPGRGICVDFWRSQDLQQPTLGVPGLPGSSGARLSEAVQPLDCKSSLPALAHAFGKFVSAGRL